MIKKKLHNILINCSYSVSVEIRKYPVSSNLHATFLYLHMIGESISDVECDSEELWEMHSCDLVIDGGNDIFYLNEKNEENIRLLKLLYTLKAVITFLQLSDLSLSNHIFWKDYLMFNIDPE